MGSEGNRGVIDLSCNLKNRWRTAILVVRLIHSESRDMVLPSVRNISNRTYWLFDISASSLITRRRCGSWGITRFLDLVGQYCVHPFRGWTSRTSVRESILVFKELDKQPTRNDSSVSCAFFSREGPSASITRFCLHPVPVALSELRHVNTILSVLTTPFRYSRTPLDQSAQSELRTGFGVCA